MTRTSLLAAATLAILIPLAAVAFGAEAESEPAPADFGELLPDLSLFEDDWDEPGFAADMGLSDEQFAKLKAERDAFYNERDRLIAAIHEEIRCMHQCFKEQTLDREQVQAHSKKIQAMRDELFQKHTDYLVRVREIVSAAQFEKMHTPRGKGRGPTPWD